MPGPFGEGSPEFAASGKNIRAVQAGRGSDRQEAMPPWVSAIDWPLDVPHIPLHLMAELPEPGCLEARVWISSPGWPLALGARLSSQELLPPWRGESQLHGQHL